MDELCDALVGTRGNRHRLRRSVRSLGVQRADADVRLRETRDDISVALVAAGLGRRLRAELLDAGTVGWAERASTAAGPPLLHAGTGLLTLPYLRTRLDELYREAALWDADMSDYYTLVVVETGETSIRLRADARLMAMYSAVRYAFVGGESIAVVPPRRVIALVGCDEPRLSDSIARLRSELKIALAEKRLRRVHSWRQALPPSHAELDTAITEVAKR